MALVRQTNLGLASFFSRLKSSFQFGGSTNRNRQDRGPAQHFVQHKDFNQLLATFMGMLTDPDEVLRKANYDTRVYREVLTDSHVKGSVVQRKSRVKKMNLIFLPGDDSPDAEKAKDMVERQVFNIRRLKNVTNEMLDAWFFGATYLEMFWNRLPTEIGTGNEFGEIVLFNIMSKPYEWFGYNQDGLLGIKDQVGVSFRLSPIPNHKIVPVVHDGTYQNPYGDRAVKSVFWPTQFKKGGLRFWTEYLEKHGSPFLLGKADANISNDELKVFHNSLIDMVRNGVAVSKNEGKFEIEVVGGGKSGATDAHKRYIDKMNVEISKGLLGETLTIENSETGSQASTAIHKEVLEELQDEDKAMCEGGYEDIAAKIIELNFPPGVKPPKAILVDPDKINMPLVERDAILHEKMNLRFTKDYFAKKHLLDEDDFEILEEPEETDPNKNKTEANQGKKETDKPDENTPAEDTDFAETTGNEFVIQKGVDAFINQKVKALDKLTIDLQEEIIKVIQSSQDDNDLLINLALIKDKIPNNEFGEVLQTALDTVAVIGDWAFKEGKI